MMGRLWRIVTDFDVEPVLLVLAILLTIPFGLLVLQAPVESPLLGQFHPWFVGWAMIGAGTCKVIGLARGSRRIVLASIPFAEFCWAILLLTTLLTVGVRNAPLTGSLFLLIALASAWTWVRILVDPGRLRAGRARLWGSSG